MYKRRVMIFLTIMCLLVAVVIGRLVQLQLFRGDDYRQMADQALQSTKLLPAGRGKIMDRKGRLLAVDKPCFDLCLDYRFLTDNKKWVKRQKRTIKNDRGVSAEKAEEIYNILADNTWEIAKSRARLKNLDLGEVRKKISTRVQTYRKRVGMMVREELAMHPVVRGLSEADKNALASRLDETIGITLRPGHMRWYPYEAGGLGGEARGTSACHIIGLTGLVSAEHQIKRREQLEEMGLGKLERQRLEYSAWDTEGLGGVEKLAEPTLRGIRGFQRLKLGSDMLENANPKSGADVQLTIDIELQTALTNEMLARNITGS
ncbi:MAG TPA: hypothetical protein ENL03_06165, partial [Phycisphaerae bacterium]|nr:hypothetical protein [Phycisphaerae bacterium]